MSRSDSTPVRVDNDQYKKLSAIRKNEGVPVTESVRRAIEEYLKKQMVAENG